MCYSGALSHLCQFAGGGEKYALMSNGLAHLPEWQTFSLKMQKVAECRLALFLPRAFFRRFFCHLGHVQVLQVPSRADASKKSRALAHTT